MKIAYLPVGRETFDIKAAENVREETISSLDNPGFQLVGGSRIITDPEDARNSAKEATDEGAKLLLVQTTTFVDGRFAVAISENWKGPLMVWSVKEPQSGGRLRLNSLTGANLLSNAFRSLGIGVRYVHGSPLDPTTMESIFDYAKVFSVIESLEGSVLGLFGDVPPGFSSGEADEVALERLFGLRLKRFALEDLFQRAEGMPITRIEEAIDALDRGVKGLERDQATENTMRAYLSLKEIIEDESLLGVAVRCWPEFFVDFGGAACGALCQLCEDGLMSACEADINGLVSMIIISKLSGGPAYMGDLVDVNQQENYATFWHCGGGGAYSLASGEVKAIPHPNREQNLALDFTLRPGKVTVTRLNRDPTGYRLLVLEGDAIDTREQHYTGTTMDVRFGPEIEEVLGSLMKEGIEHHYALGYGHLGEPLRELARQVGLEIVDIPG